MNWTKILLKALEEVGKSLTTQILHEILNPKKTK